MLHPPEYGQVILGVVPVLVPNRADELVTLLSVVALVRLSTCTVHPVLRFVPVIPLLPLLQLSVGVAGMFEELQALTVTVLLAMQTDSPTPCALAVMMSPLAKPETVIVQVPPEETEVVPMLATPLYKVIVAVVIKELVALVQVPVIEVVEGVIGPFNTGAAVQLGPTPLPPDFKLSRVKGGCDVIAVVQSFM